MSARDLALHGPAPGRILVVMLSAIGDAVHVLPVVNALKRTWPATEITWMIQPVRLASVLISGFGSDAADESDGVRSAAVLA